MSDDGTKPCGSCVEGRRNCAVCGGKAPARFDCGACDVNGKASCGTCAGTGRVKRQ